MEQKQHHQGGIGQGFFLGVIVGVVITLLFTTKKGREIFKEWTEKGLDKFSELEKKLQQTEASLEKIDDENDYITPEKRPELPEPAKEVRHIAHEKAEPAVHHKAEEKPEPKEKEESPKSTVRKFFRRK